MQQRGRGEQLAGAGAYVLVTALLLWGGAALRVEAVQQGSGLSAYLHLLSVLAVGALTAVFVAWAARNRLAAGVAAGAGLALTVPMAATQGWLPSRLLASVAFQPAGSEASVILLVCGALLAGLALSLLGQGRRAS